MGVQENIAEIFFMRHGQTPSNVGGMHGGGLLKSKSDQPLTEKGVEATVNSLARLSRLGLQTIFAPDQPRYRQTADIIAQALQLPVVLADGFAERGYGELDGKLYSEVQGIKNRWLVDQSQPNEHGIESDAVLAARLMPELKNIALAHLGSKALVVTGSAIFKYLYHEFENVPYEDILEKPVGNNAVMRVDYEDGSGSFVFRDKL